MVVRHVKLQDLYDMGEKPSFDMGVKASEDLYDQQQLYRVGIDGKDDVDVTPKMEKECVDDEDVD